MTERTLRGKVAIAGIGETIYYKHGQSPDAEFKLALQAILAACQDAGIDPARCRRLCLLRQRPVGRARLAAALGVKELRFSNMQWGGGGGGVAAAVGNAGAAVHSGMANCVIAFRSLAQGQFARYGRGRRRRRRGRRCLPRALWRDVAGAALRHEDHPLHERQRHPA